MSVQESHLIAKLKDVLEAKSSTPLSREGALLALASIAGAAGIQSEPYLEPLLPALFTVAGDKVGLLGNLL
jgi:hypothetical protein